jgi:hypothetical protein
MKNSKPAKSGGMLGKKTVHELRKNDKNFPKSPVKLTWSKQAINE